MTDLDSEYSYTNAAPTHANNYLWPVVFAELDTLLGCSPDELEGAKRRVLDLGCGNGATSNELARRGNEVVGVDPSESGIAQARSVHSMPRFEVASAYDDLPARYGVFDAVISLEVIEHVMWPRAFADVAYRSLKPGGHALISTPYHGYWKNLALALTGKMDDHFTALWDGGHIKFWSERTLTRLLSEQGFTQIRFLRVGRIAPLAKSMVAIARRPITEG